MSYDKMLNGAEPALNESPLRQLVHNMSQCQYLCHRLLRLLQYLSSWMAPERGAPTP